MSVLLSKDWALKILIIDDDEDDFFITSEYIKSIPENNFLIDWCYNYKEALQQINDRKYNLYLVDYHLGANTGLDLIKEARGKNSEEPFILLTGKGNQRIDREAMEAGAVDYLIKSDLDSEKLERCIRYSIERANAVKALKANERKFRKIFERSADAVFLANEQLFFNDINDATTRLLEYEKNELLAMNLFSVLASDEGKANLDEELSKSKELDDKEVILKTKSGNLKYCILSLSQEFNAAGAYYQGIIHDITNIKKAERATLRTEKRNVADRLVHVLAHEVRNPLNNINLSLEQLSPDVQKTEDKVFLDIISRNSKRIEDLITELLSSSRPAQIELKEIALQEVVESSIVAALDRITLKKIKLNKTFPATPVMIWADPEKLKIALLNIIINAIEAMKQGEGELSVTINDNDKNQLTIQDNGCGISDENLSKLFEPYFTAKRNGMGLGLATTLNILQSHKAEVEVHSKLNEGSAFIITFPKN
ncbi:MAG TPA: ATP-binding protein [Ferruginibacter sp.]|nr:ATP-binding protein [Ferruginibacter sp.]